jgi:hypothetical protein
MHRIINNRRFKRHIHVVPHPTVHEGDKVAQSCLHQSMLGYKWTVAQDLLFLTNKVQSGTVIKVINGQEKEIPDCLLAQKVENV